MSINSPRGLVEARNTGGRVSPITRLRRVKANGDSGAHQKFAGDPVILVSGNTVARAPQTATTASIAIVGVIRAVLTNATFGKDARPRTFSQPDGGPFIPASTAGWVEVNEDPNQTYLVNSASTVTSTHIGQFIDISAGTPNTAAGRSGFNAALGTATNTALATVPYHIVGIADNNLDGIVGGENNQDIEVRIANHAWATNRPDHSSVR